MLTSFRLRLPHIADEYSIHGDRHIRRLTGRRAEDREDVGAGLVAVYRAGEPALAGEFGDYERGVSRAEKVAGFVAGGDGDEDGAGIGARHLDVGLAGVGLQFDQ